MFTQPCFIRKNTFELKKKLEEFGYIVHLGNIDSTYIMTFGTHAIPKQNVSEIENELIDYNSSRDFESDKLYMNDYIDCGINEKLFLAISALRDDTDKNQYFVTEANQAWFNQGIYAKKGSLILCLTDDYYIGQKKEICNILPAHKATVEELIEKLQKNDSKK